MENPIGMYAKVPKSTQMYAFYFAAAAYRRRGRTLPVFPIYNVKERTQNIVRRRGIVKGRAASAVSRF